MWRTITRFGAWQKRQHAFLMCELTYYWNKRHKKASTRKLGTIFESVMAKVQWQTLLFPFCASNSHLISENQLRHQQFLTVLGSLVWRCRNRRSAADPIRNPFTSHRHAAVGVGVLGAAFERRRSEWSDRKCWKPSIKSEMKYGCFRK